MDYKKEIIIRSIKIIDIGYVTAIYLVLGLYFATFVDSYFILNEQKESMKSHWQILFEIIYFSWMIGILSYGVRNIVPIIPFPLDGIYGFNHKLVKEVLSDSAFLFSFLYFNKFYQKKLKFYQTTYVN